MADLPKILDRRLVTPGSLFKVEQLDLEFSNGVQRRYERLHSSGLGAVIIVPILANGQVLLLREYAAGLHRYEIGLPKGRLEPGESPEAGANRELQEEAGYAAKRLDVINQLSLAPGYMGHQTQVVLARDLYPSRLPGDEPEEIETMEWPLKDLFGLAGREDVTEGRSIAALYFARDYLALEETKDD
ncbi:MAG: ADP compounds hydrolase NudE [Xanthomonadales bacterium]|nr:ADP compounds hydrolase NudE [Xanthomonadales bacterium]